MNRRWKILNIAIALVNILLSVCFCMRAYHYLQIVPSEVYSGLLSSLLLCGSALMIVMLLLSVFMVLYLHNKGNMALQVAYISVFMLLMLNGIIAVTLAKVVPDLELTMRLIGLYSLVLAPIALLVSVYSKPDKSMNVIWIAAGCIALSAVLPIVLLFGFDGDLEPGYWAAMVSLIVGIIVCSLKCRKRVKEMGIRNFIGLAVGLGGLGASLIAASLYRIIFGQYPGIVIYGIYALMAGVVFDIIRSASSIDKQLGDYDDLRRREEEFRFATHHINMFVLRYHVAQKCITCRDDVAEAFDLPKVINNAPQALVDMGLIVESSVDNLLEMYKKIDAGMPSGSGVFGIYDTNHMPVWFHTDFTTSFDEYGVPQESIISSYIIVGMKEKEAAYERWSSQYHEYAQSPDCSYFEINLSQGLLRQAEGELMPPAPEEVARNADSLIAYLLENSIAEEDREAVGVFLNRGRLLSCYEQDVRHESQECRRKKGGDKPWTAVSARLVSDPHSNDILAFVMFKDIDEQKSKEAREKSRSMSDELTGLLSRAAFKESMVELCANSEKGVCHAVIMIDLDGFKAVNDTFGHRFGDKVLIDVANDLRAINRSDDLIARMGGDEYMLCIKNIPHGTSFLETRCRAISHTLSKQYGDTVAISGSVGIAVFPKDGTTFDELYQHADQAQYSAKQSGRNRYVFYGSENPAVEEKGEEEKKSEEKPQETAQASAEKKPGHRHTLLITDDQRINRVLMREIFSDVYDILEAKNGREALEILRNPQHSISAMVLDLIMPEVSGLDVLGEMNKDVYYQTIPVIVISSADEDEFGMKALELGAVDFVNKPIDERIVRLRVRNAIIRRESEELRAQNRDLLVQRSDETRHQNQLRYIADHDALTHICNKSAFYRKTKDMLEKHKDVTYCLVSFDVQRFRAVNDIFGHEEGDKLLKFIATQMRNMLGHDGTYTRAEMDNFAFCIPFDKEKVEGHITALRTALKNYELNFEIQLSFGIYVIKDIELPVNQMYDRSEIAKRTIKSSYVKRIAYYDDNMRETLLAEQEIVSCMNAALDEGEFLVYYQPKCLLDTGMIVGAEALVRWNHKTRGLLPPGVFVPIFEKNGFIMKIDIYMWEQVCKFLSKRLKEDPNDRLHVSVNISRANLYNPNLCRTLDELCKRYGVPNDRMEVEITESAYVENAHLLRGLTDDLHRLGFTVEMDDFGSGYSSLNMLKEIPVDVLKLDMRFLYGIQNDERGSSILNSTVRMAQQLHLQVIAEGVENEEQARFLAAIGCKQAQGYYYAKPMPEADFIERYDSQPSIDEAVHGSLQDAKEQIERLLCSAAVCERFGNDIRLINVNEYYMRMMRINHENFEEVDSLLSYWTGTQDMNTLCETMDRAKATGELAECVYLQQDLSDSYHLLRASVLHLCGEEKSEYYLLTLDDAASRVDRSII